MKRYLPTIIVVFVGLASIASALRLYQIKKPHALTMSGDQSSKPGADEGLHIRGNPDAPITVEEFGDYQCPPCGTLAQPLNQIEHDFSPKVRLIFSNYPLPLHQHARAAASAAEAAGLQGKFWEMHDLIYKQQAVWSKARDVQPLFTSYAGLLGLDLERFKKDAESEAVKARIDRDQKRGASIGVQNTPTIFLNNRAVPPTDLAPDRLRAAVEKAVKNIASASPSSSPRKK
jgi:protein-disulfide isomerase